MFQEKAFQIITGCIGNLPQPQDIHKELFKKMNLLGKVQASFE
jgi:hypothetical protein